MTGDLHPDLCIVGAGPGGLTLAAGAAQLGARVVLVEGAAMGGDCLNTGCVPSKALLAAARAGCDYPQAMAQAAATIAAIAPHDSVARFEGLGVQVLRGWARFTGPRRLVVSGPRDGQGDSRSPCGAETGGDQGGPGIVARRFVLATGSVPILPDLPGLAGVPYLTTDTLWSLRRRPEHLLILGAGAVGLEMAEAHARLGSRVTLIDTGRALAREEPEAAAVVTGALRGLGVTLHEAAQPHSVSAGAGGVCLTLADGRRLAGSHLLVAVGRRPDLGRLNLPAARVDVGAQGILTDSRLRSSNRRILAIGDAAGRGQTTPLAAYHAGVVLRRTLFALPSRLRSDHIPQVLHTDPGLARIGLTEAEARLRYGPRLTVSRADFTNNDRARAEGRTEGFCKLLVHRGRAVGVTIAGPLAGELIVPWALIFAGRLKLSLQMSAVLPYPLRSEVSSRATSAYFAPRLFGSAPIKRIVRLVQRLVP